MNLEKVCSEVRDLTDDVGDFIRGKVYEIKKDDILLKGVNNFVTYVDITAEKRLVKKLQEIIPHAGFITEEQTNTRKGDRFNWVIDPLDGTTNFLHSIPCFSISIALMDEDRVVMGVVYEINFDECFYAWDNSVAFLNDKIIKTSDAKTLGDSLLATGFPYSDEHLIDQYSDILKYFMKNTHGIRRIGSAAVDLAYVACGRFEGFYEYGLNSWDVAAGAFIVQQAGGKAGDFSGKNNYIFGKEIVASCQGIYDEFLKALSEHLVIKQARF